MQKQWAMFSIQQSNPQTLQPDLCCTKLVQIQHAISNLKWTFKMQPTNLKWTSKQTLKVQHIIPNLK